MPSYTTPVVLLVKHKRLVLGLSLSTCMLMVFLLLSLQTVIFLMQSMVSSRMVVKNCTLGELLTVLRKLQEQLLQVSLLLLLCTKEFGGMELLLNLKRVMVGLHRTKSLM